VGRLSKSGGLARFRGCRYFKKKGGAEEGRSISESNSLESGSGSVEGGHWANSWERSLTRRAGRSTDLLGEGEIKRKRGRGLTKLLTCQKTPRAHWGEYCLISGRRIPLGLFSREISRTHR